ncbi:PqiC family protein [Desulfolutivibrio sulfoxidireducens]|uniref:PqiC family protein n=1 Tax=Desulfolutivibrio sulfoxidireducens TaxID=2773299 RepID=UPI00159DCC94|nr:PqiC family protein [Desulfolutivibrio sulfoxidireducens]QLA20095.1 hypothetical protein GD604_10360 [Desulfolutivibrio sulfoxidireducens]
MQTRVRRLGGLAAGVLCLALASAGCGKSAPARFYTLTATAGSEQNPGDVAVARPAGVECTVLGIGPVELPAYLDRTQIVTQGGTTSMHLAEFDQWIEPVHDNFQRILMENLSGMLRAGPLVSHPWPVGMHPERQVAIQVRRFDGELGQQAVLRAEWGVFDADGRMLLWRQTALREPVNGPDYPALVAAQSRLVTVFAAEIAQSLERGR